MVDMTLKYAYFPGCVAQGACRELYQSTGALTKALGIELIELKKAACCGSGTFKEDSQLLEDTVNARNIALAEDLNLPLLTHCSTCQGVIGNVDERLKDAHQSNPAYLDQVNHLLTEEGCSPYRGTSEVKHLLWALVGDFGLDELQKRVTRKLSGLKCASFYGCYLLRAQKQIPFDDPHAPESMENVFRAIDATPVYYRGRTQCCGWPLSSYATTQSFQMAGGHIREAIAAGADCIVSGKLIGLLMTQISQNRHLAGVFHELFSPEGQEIHLRPAGAYVRTGRDAPFAAVVESALRKGECAIGYRAHARPATGPHYGVRINPDKARVRRWDAEDRIIVIAES